VQNQEHVRTFVKVQVQKDALVVQNVRSGTCDAPNAAVELRIVWCGPANGTEAALPVGSVQDEVTIHPNHGDGQDIQVDVPDAAPGEFGWTINGHNGLVDLGTAAEKNNSYFEATGQINPITVTDTRRAVAPGRSQRRSATSPTAASRSPESTSAGPRRSSPPRRRGRGCADRLGLRRRHRPVRLADTRLGGPGPRPRHRRARLRPGSEDPGRGRQGQLPRHPHPHRDQQLMITDN
jgi:hypothetical protein